jgi:uridine kinase
MVLSPYEHIKNDIQNLLKKKDHVIIAIDGMSASGKSTIAHQLKDDLKTNLIHMDDFFLRDHQRTNKRLDEVGGNIDYERFLEEVIKPLENHQPLNYHQYNCQTKTMRPIKEKPNPITIVEGAYALREEFFNTYDLTYLFIIDESIQASRIKKRNPKNYQRFIKEWMPKENTYIKANDLKNKVNQVFFIK